MNTTRRQFIAGSAAAMACALTTEPLVSSGAQEPPTGTCRMLRRHALDTERSPLSVGYETLDRKMFDPDRTFYWAGELGVKWARCQTGWCRCERKKGRYDFAWLDRVVDDLLRMGVSPWLSLSYGNQLYSPEAPDVSAVGFAPIDTYEQHMAWKAFVTAISQHFAGRVQAWEIWNEPNHPKFWRPGPSDPKRYVDLVAMTAPILREQTPDATIVGGALAGMPADYLQGCLEAGMGEYVDKVSYHPYRATPERNYETDLSRFRDLIEKHAPRLGLWQGENGCPSEQGSAGALGGQAWNEAKQAVWLARRILTDLRLGVELTSYFHLCDLVSYNWGDGATAKTNSKGLLRVPGYTPKLAFAAYQMLATLFDAQTSRVAERLDVPAGLDVQTAVFARDGFPMYVYWQPTESCEIVDAPRLPIRELRVPDRVQVDRARAIEKPVLVRFDFEQRAGVIHMDDSVQGDSGEVVVPRWEVSPMPTILTDWRVVAPYALQATPQTVKVAVT